MSDLKSLPVAPEFIEALEENVTKTALDYLRKIKAEPDLITLVENISNFGYYLSTAYRNPESLLGERASRFGIEEMVVEAVNAIANLGGEFHAPSGTLLPREETLPVSKQSVKKNKQRSKKSS